MKLAALFSGGKDSSFAIHLAKQAGHEVSYLATVISKNPDSFMYHTANIGLTSLQSECLGIQLVSKESAGEKEKEVEDLKALLEGLDVDGVAVGAIASRYQYERVKRVCDELNLKVYAPLWGMDLSDYWNLLLGNKFKIIITAVAADGFDESWLGREMDKNALEDLKRLSARYGINLCGEGGCYETLVLDCPMFKKRIRIDESRKIFKDFNGILSITKASLVTKDTA